MLKLIWQRLTGKSLDFYDHRERQSFARQRAQQFARITAFFNDR